MEDIGRGRRTALIGELGSCKVEWCGEVATECSAQGRGHAGVDDGVFLESTRLRGGIPVIKRRRMSLRSFMSCQLG